MRLAEILGESVGGEITTQEVATYLRKKTVASDYERLRRNGAQRRADLYVDHGHHHMAAYIDAVFEDPTVRDKRKQWISRANYNNVTRRIVHEISTLYRSPAKRTVAKEAGDLNYQALQRDLNINSQMLKIQRLANLHRYLFVMFRTVDWNGASKPLIEVIEPQNMFLVSDPVEPKRLACLIYDVAATPIEISGRQGPRYRGITDGELFYLDASGTLMPETIVPNELGRIPGTLLALDPPSNALYDATTGEDIVSAHMAVWFENILLMKESKSATKQPILQGDNTNMARAQAADSEVAVEAPDGVLLTTLDLSMDLNMFRDTADHILERCAANHGIPPAILHHAGATSGYEIELRHIGIRERRIEQETPFRAFERELAGVMADVAKASAPEYAFDMIGWSINFGDVQAPQSPMEALTVFEAKRRLGLTNTVEEIMRQDPDLDVERAVDMLMSHIDIEISRNQAMRPLQEIQGSMAESVDTTPLVEQVAVPE